MQHSEKVLGAWYILLASCNCTQHNLFVSSISPETVGPAENLSQS